MATKLLARLGHLRTLARLTPFDVSTEAGRSNERQRLVAVSAAASLLGRVVSVAASLLSVPLTLNYLGDERFGLWMTISSVIAMLSFADLGIGNGLLSFISNAYGRNDSQAIKRYVSSASAILSSIALAVVLVFFLVYPLISWKMLFNVHSDLAIRESGQAMAVFVICFAANIPISVVQRTQLGLQLGFMAHLWQMLGSIMSLASVLLVIHFELGLPWLVGGMAGAPVLAMAVNGMLFFWVKRPDIRPGMLHISHNAMKEIAHVGLLFLLLQVVAAIVSASDNLVIAQLLGANAVAQYSVPEKLFSIVPILLSMVLMPLWPAYGESIARRDGQWVKKTFINSMVITILFATIVAGLLAAFSNTLLSYWLGKDIAPAPTLIFGLAAWKVVEAIAIALAALLNGCGVVKAQVLVASVTAICAISLKLYLVPVMGVAGVVWATLLAYVCCALLPYFIWVPRILRKIGAAT